MMYVTDAGSEIKVMPSGSFIADWDGVEEVECCLDARPIDVLVDEGRLIVTVACLCCGEFEVIATKESK